MLRALAKAVLAALEQGGFLDRIADLMADRVKLRLNQFEDLRRSAFTQVDARFADMGMTGLFMQRMMKEQLGELIQMTEAESNGQLNAQDLIRVLDGIDATELSSARTILINAVQNAVNKAIAEKS